MTNTNTAPGSPQLFDANESEPAAPLQQHIMNGVRAAVHAAVAVQGLRRKDQVLSALQTRFANHPRELQAVIDEEASNLEDGPQEIPLAA